MGEEETEEEKYDMYLWQLDFNPMLVKAKTKDEAKALFLKYINENIDEILIETGDDPDSDEFDFEVGVVIEEEEDE